MELGTRVRRAALLAAGLLLAGASAVLSAPTSTASGDQLSVDVTAVTVTGTGPEAVVQLQATVTNTSASPVDGARVGIWRSRDPITDLDALRQVTGTSSPRGFLFAPPEGRTQIITQETEPFAPGASAQVSLAATLAELGFDTPGAAYTIGILAMGRDNATGTYPQAGLGRTVIALPADPVPVTRVVVLAARPTKLTAGVFQTDDLATQLEGRLDALLSAAASPGMSWLIDPALYDEIYDMADGYQVRREGGLIPGTGQAAAANWLARFAQLNRAEGARSLFANPDLAGAAAASDPTVLSRAVVAGATVSPLTDLPLVVLPTDAVYTTAIDTYLDGSATKAVLATNVGTAGALQPTSGLPVLAATDHLGPTNLTDLQRNQVLQAEAVIAGQSGQLRLLREPVDLAVDTASTTGWMTQRGLSALLTHPPSGTKAELLPQTIPVLDRAHFEGIDDIEGYFADYGELVPSSTVTDEAAAFLSRAASASWIGDPSGYRGFSNAIGALIGPRALAQAVTIDASPRFVMSSRTNEFPVTLTNHLEETIRVKVLVNSENPLRLQIPATRVVTIAPNQSETVNIRPEATGNGVVQVEAYAATESGQRLIPPRAITIEITELGFIGGLIVLGSGVVLVLATALRILQVRRKNATTTPEAAHG